MDNNEVVSIAVRRCGEDFPDKLASMEKGDYNHELRMFKELGLSICQTERLTDIGGGITGSKGHI